MIDPPKFWEIIYILSEVFVIILYLFCTEYGDGVHPSALNTKFQDEGNGGYMVSKYYPVFQDVHVMIFVGFGFLMVFLKTHSWTSVGFNFLISCWALQLSILITAFWHQLLGDEPWHKIQINIPSLIIGDFGAGCAMITMGALLGKHSLAQIWLLVTLEIFFYGLNETICAGKMGAVDMGGSMYVHTFGAYFGLAATYFFNPSKAMKDERGLCQGGYNSQLIAMVGTVFLFMFWPSFNGALASETQQQRVIVNTVLAISASGITSCGVSRLILQRLDMEVVLNATLAGGVAIGTSSDLTVTGGTAMAIGALSGIVSALGFLKLNEFLQRKINLHDTCGVHNLHGIPGIMGAIFGAISVSASEDAFNSQTEIESTFSNVKDGETVSYQATIQLGALGITLVIAIVGGVISGFIASRFAKIEYEFDDKEHFAHVDYGVIKYNTPQQMHSLNHAAISDRDLDGHK